MQCLVLWYLLYVECVRNLPSATTVACTVCILTAAGLRTKSCTLGLAWERKGQHPSQVSDVGRCLPMKYKRLSASVFNGTALNANKLSRSWRKASSTKGERVSATALSRVGICLPPFAIPISSVLLCCGLYHLYSRGPRPAGPAGASEGYKVVRTLGPTRFGPNRPAAYMGKWRILWLLVNPYEEKK